MQVSTRVIVTAALQQIQVSIGRNMFRFCIFVGPIITGFILGMMYRLQSDSDYIVHVVFGGGIFTFWGSILFSSASDIERERSMGTLESIFAAPGGFSNIILGKIIGNSLWGILAMVINAGFVLIVFGRRLIIHNLPLMMLTIALMFVSFTAIAMLMAGLFTLSRKSRLVMNCLEHPIAILCGIMFPLSVLPNYIRPLSYLLSPTYVSLLLKDSVEGTAMAQYGGNLIGLVVVSLIYIITTVKVYRIIEYRARVSATLGVY